jgi:hypothetical protein
MLSLTRDLLKKTKDRDELEIKPLTVCFWSDFTNNPSIMYGLFSPNPHKLNYDPDKVKVMGTKDGMINQINISTMEDLESFHEQILGVPMLLRVWAAFARNDYVGEAQPQTRFEGDLALLVDTSHPMIRPQLEKALDEARRIMHSRGLFCVQIDFGYSIEAWLRSVYSRGYCGGFRIRNHKARLYITNYNKPEHCMDCNPIWCICLGPCWLLSAPFYKLFRHLKCNDIVVSIDAPIVRRAVLAISGKIVEATR